MIALSNIVNEVDSIGRVFSDKVECPDCGSKNIHAGRVMKHHPWKAFCCKCYFEFYLKQVWNFSLVGLNTKLNTTPAVSGTINPYGSGARDDESIYSKRNGGKLSWMVGVSLAEAKLLSNIGNYRGLAEYVVIAGLETT